VNRPWVWAAVGLAAGVFGATEGLAFSLLLPSIVVCLLALFALRKRLPYVLHAALVLAAFGVGVVLYQARHAGPPGDSLSRHAAASPMTRYTIEGRVRAAGIILPGADYTTFVLDADRVVAGGDATDLRGGVLVRWTAPDGPLYPGERVRVQGALGRVLAPVNHGIRDMEDYYRARGVHTDLRVAGDGVVRLSAPRWSVRYWVARLRQGEGARLARAVPEEVLPFVLAVWLGERSRLAEAERDAYVASGTAHILAVSGVHMGIVYISVYFVVGALLRRRRPRAVLTLGLVVLFAALAGARPSTLRAAFMISLYLAAEFFDREPDAPTALSLAGIVLLLVNPNDLLDPGFQLSFASVASLLLFSPRILEWINRGPWPLRNAAAPTLAVQLLPLPIAMRSFHVLPIAAPPANLLVVPLLSIALWLCAMTTLAAFLMPSAAVLFGHALLPVVAMIRGVAHLVASTPYAHRLVTSPTAFAVALYWGALLLSWIPAATTVGRKRKRFATAALFLGVPLAWAPWSPPASIDVLDVGRSDALFVRTPENTTFLIDGGDRSEYIDMGKRVVVPFLLAHHARRVDYVVVTHPDRDHIGGLFHVIERLPVGEVLLGPDPTGRALEMELIALCERRNVPVRRLQRGDRLEFRETVVEVLHPPPGRPVDDKVNDNSLVLRFAWPGVTALFTGDIEAPGEQLLAAADCRADIMKAPHHGSKTSSTPQFIAAAAPSIVLVSTRDTARGPGADNAVIERYLAAGAQVWRTDRHGGLRVRQTPSGPHIDGARVLRGYAPGPPPPRPRTRTRSRPHSQSTTPRTRWRARRPARYDAYVTPAREEHDND